VAAGRRIRFLGWALPGLLSVAAAGEPPARTAPALVELLDLDGARRRPLEDLGTRGTVFVFARTDCPVSNRYAPELRRLHERFAPAGVTFWLVYPERAETVAGIRRHQEEFAYPFGALRDPEHGLVRMARATVTPEAAVFVAGPSAPRLVYRGRIDDRYVAFGKARPAPKTRDLERVLERIVAGRLPGESTTRPIGCFISSPE
jgi:hypothetical protein